MKNEKKLNEMSIDELFNQFDKTVIAFNIVKKIKGVNQREIKKNLIYAEMAILKEVGNRLDKLFNSLDK